MEYNADFSQRAVVHAQEKDWIASPMPGVSRKMLDRVGDEVARATTIVKYEPNSHFSPHVHTGGEEFVVLEGVFQDEHGDFPAGSYIRNPPESSHTPGSKLGCVIMVKLWQFDLNDRSHVRLDSNKMEAVNNAIRPGVKTVPLYKDHREVVSIEYWQAGATIALDASQGAEVFVLDGNFIESNENFKKHSWLRSPINSQLSARVGDQGATVWVKTHHLPFVDLSILPQ